MLAALGLSGEDNLTASFVYRLSACAYCSCLDVLASGTIAADAYASSSGMFDKGTTSLFSSPLTGSRLYAEA